MIDELSVLNKNLSLIVVEEHHTVETCQNSPIFNLTFILQIWQKSVASLCLEFLPLFNSFLLPFFGVLLIKFKVNTKLFLQFPFGIVD